MNREINGVVSLGLVALATAVAAVALFRVSRIWGLVYLAANATVPFDILYFYCAKCPCKENCAHVLPGKAAMIFAREPGPYTALELGMITLSLLTLIGLPQIWLWRYPLIFLLYWLLIGVALVQIRLILCRTCGNVYCPLRSEGE